MKPSTDMQNLYHSFGGDPSTYQEIGRENEVSVARGRWPLLSHLTVQTHNIPPIAPRDLAVPPHDQDDQHRVASASRTAMTSVLAARRSRQALNESSLRPAAAATTPPSYLGGARFSTAHEAAQAAPVPLAAPAAAIEPVVPNEERRTLPTSVPNKSMERVEPQTRPAASSSNPGTFQVRAQAQRPARLGAHEVRVDPIVPMRAPAAARENPKSRDATSGQNAQKAPTILGRMFQTLAAPDMPAAPSTESLQTLFERLRAPGTNATEHDHHDEPWDKPLPPIWTQRR